MKDIHKNPMFYYILVPIVMISWPLLIRAKYLPAASDAKTDKLNECKKAELMMLEILNLDPDRAPDANGTAKEFSYSTEVYRFAEMYNIPADKCNLSSKGIVETRQQTTQGATVVLQDVDVEKGANFLDALQKRWPGLECERIKLDAVKGVKNSWRIDITFKYYY